MSLGYRGLVLRDSAVVLRGSYGDARAEAR